VRHDFGQCREVDPADPAKGIEEDSLLCLDLRVDSELRPVAASAGTGLRAGIRSAIRARLDQVEQIRPPESLFISMISTRAVSPGRCRERKSGNPRLANCVSACNERIGLDENVLADVNGRSAHAGSVVQRRSGETPFWGE